MNNFWQKLPRPFSVLAPMEDVTDTVFRQVMVKAGRPDVFFTEFTSVDGMDSKGAEKVEYRLRFDVSERPVVAQIWGRDPEKFKKAARRIKALGFDGIDINMGCPDRAVLKQGCGAALSDISFRDIVGEIILAVKEGSGGLPVSLKTRLGNKKREEGWIEFLLEQELAALTIHARIAKDMSLVPADWEAIKKIVNIKKQLGSKTLIIGNGDIKSLDDLRIEESGVDGVMIGRGVFENPWIFNNAKNNQATTDRLELLKYHLELWNKEWGNSQGRYLKDYSIMKKFFKMYIRDFDGAAELRARLMETLKVEEAFGLL